MYEIYSWGYFVFFTKIKRQNGVKSTEEMLIEIKIKQSNRRGNYQLSQMCAKKKQNTATVSERRGKSKICSADKLVTEVRGTTLNDIHLNRAGAI